MIHNPDLVFFQYANSLVNLAGFWIVVIGLLWLFIKCLDRLRILIRNFVMDILQIKASAKSQELDALQRRVRIVMQAHPFAGEIVDMEDILRQLMVEHRQLKADDDQERMYLGGRFVRLADRVSRKLNEAGANEFRQRLAGIKAQAEAAANSLIRG